MVKVNELVLKFEVRDDENPPRASNLHPKVFLSPRPSLGQFIPKSKDGDLRSKFVSPDDGVRRPVRNKSGSLGEPKRGVSKRSREEEEKGELREEREEKRDEGAETREEKSKEEKPSREVLRTAEQNPQPQHSEVTKVPSSDGELMDKIDLANSSKDETVVGSESPAEKVKTTHLETAGSFKPVHDFKIPIEELSPVTTPQKPQTPEMGGLQRQQHPKEAEQAVLRSPFVRTHKRTKESISSFESSHQSTSLHERHVHSAPSVTTPATEPQLKDFSPVKQLLSVRNSGDKLADVLSETVAEDFVGGVNRVKPETDKLPRKVEARSENAPVSRLEKPAIEPAQPTVGPLAQEKPGLGSLKPQNSLSSYYVTTPCLHELLDPFGTSSSAQITLQTAEDKFPSLKTDLFRKLRSSSSGLGIQETNDTNVWSAVVPLHSWRRSAKPADRLSFADHGSPDSGRFPTFRHPYKQMQPASFRQSETFCQTEPNGHDDLPDINNSNIFEMYGGEDEKTENNPAPGSGGVKSAIVQKWLRKIHSLFSARKPHRRNPDIPSQPVLSSATTIPFVLPPMVPRRREVDLPPNSYSLYVEELAKSGVAISPREYLKFLEKNLDEHEWQQYLVRFASYIEQRFSVGSDADVGLSQGPEISIVGSRDAGVSRAICETR